MEDTMNIKDHDLRKLLDILYTKELERKVTLNEKEELNRKIGELNNTVESLQKSFLLERQEYQNRIANLEQALESERQEYQNRIANLEQALESERQEYKQNENESESKIVHLENTLADQNNLLVSKDRLISEQQSELVNFSLSNSWRITRPLRKIADCLRRKSL